MAKLLKDQDVQFDDDASKDEVTFDDEAETPPTNNLAAYSDYAKAPMRSGPKEYGLGESMAMKALNSAAAPLGGLPRAMAYQDATSTIKPTELLHHPIDTLSHAKDVYDNNIQGYQEGLAEMGRQHPIGSAVGSLAPGVLAGGIGVVRGLASAAPEGVALTAEAAKALVRRLAAGSGLMGAESSLASTNADLGKAATGDAHELGHAALDTTVGGVGGYLGARFPVATGAGLTAVGLESKDMDPETRASLIGSGTLGLGAGFGGWLMSRAADKGRTFASEALESYTTGRRDKFQGQKDRLSDTISSSSREIPPAQAFLEKLKQDHVEGSAADVKNLEEQHGLARTSREAELKRGAEDADRERSSFGEMQAAKLQKEQQDRIAAKKQEAFKGFTKAIEGDPDHAPNKIGAFRKDLTTEGKAKAARVRAESKQTKDLAGVDSEIAALEDEAKAVQRSAAASVGREDQRQNIREDSIRERLGRLSDEDKKKIDPGVFEWLNQRDEGKVPYINETKDLPTPQQHGEAKQNEGILSLAKKVEALFQKRKGLLDTKEDPRVVADRELKPWSNLSPEEGEAIANRHGYDGIDANSEDRGPYAVSKYLEPDFKPTLTAAAKRAHAHRLEALSEQHGLMLDDPENFRLEAFTPENVRLRSKPGRQPGSGEERESLLNADMPEDWNNIDPEALKAANRSAELSRKSAEARAAQAAGPDGHAEVVRIRQRLDEARRAAASEPAGVFKQKQNVEKLQAQLADAERKAARVNKRLDQEVDPENVDKLGQRLLKKGKGIDQAAVPTGVGEVVKRYTSAPGRGTLGNDAARFAWYNIRAKKLQTNANTAKMVGPLMSAVMSGDDDTAQKVLKAISEQYPEMGL